MRLPCGAGREEAGLDGALRGDRLWAGAGDSGASEVSSLVVNARCDLAARARLRSKRTPGAGLAIQALQTMLQCNISRLGMVLRALAYVTMLRPVALVLPSLGKR